MEGFWTDALALLLRWLHVVAAIAWIGESFYFVALDRGLKAAKIPQPGLAGESWSVHGGGFYHKQKYLPAPAELPAELHWSKWKSYTTWLSGMALFALLYLLAPSIHLVDPAVAALTPAQAVMLALAFPLAGWIAYDVLCRIAGFRDALLGALVALLAVVLCWGAMQVFAPRAAFLIVGAVLGTIMSANVFFVIIPGQKRMVAALEAGDAPNPLDGARGKQRSVHNTYLTLPVVFAMLSNHYPAAYAHEHAWAVLALFMLAGAMIRQFFVLWHSGQRAWWLPAAGTVLLLVTFAWLAPRTQPVPSLPEPGATPSSTPVEAAPTSAYPERPDTVAIAPIFSRHCTQCHSATPTLMASPPKGAMFDNVAQIERQAVQVHQQTVVLKIMPPGNLTGMTEDERAAIARWYAARQR